MITIIYSCMGREDNLIESLCSWAGVEHITEIIIVDWSCKKKLIEYKELNIPKTKIVRVNNEQFFDMSKSYNVAASYVTNKIMLKLDCDHKNINPKWIDYLKLNDAGQLDGYFIVGDYRFAQSYSGLVLVNIDDFLWYNENLSGWGYDDTDLYNRIQLHKKITRIPFFCIKDYIYHIPHDDNMRTENFEIRDRNISNNQNALISSSNAGFTLSQYTTVHRDDTYIELIRK